ncbi:helix-turn-helix domain-containing protein [Lactobacillus hominis]|uniref:Bacteriophage transcriptional regulator n=1 Tax=Lactobacillus hominis DSM 23910 = CRBIP 24.179 TaxID=1423758 RepID=I7L5R6_9LACO|nr:helix-turn-helix transcriptional regulator [Lactobacillus hominis]KRM85879.1 hypothetical protein FC41_GL000071 [Lactobacillus hominis DSM 23910 = CRBIP 24.179]MCT3348886.1 XRE family transcriptional regulator [Lactobacillus hominis]CCI81567.1 Bacteriophage transcriptional regulator [Lactobacillus hominis DSM 23910 = CRBIP 24.179]
MTTKNGYVIFSKIQEIANKRGMSIRQVALKSGFNSPNAIYRYKQGVSPRKTTLNAIAEALHTTPEYLLGETDDWQKHKSAQTKKINLDELEDDTVLATLNGKPLSDNTKKRYYALLKALDETDNENKQRK